MTANEIRDSFKKFFESKQHAIVPSAPMVIKDDPTLMFTNAGMNQWKDIILGTREPEPRRRADTQKCLRVSGKQPRPGIHRQGDCQQRQHPFRHQHHPAPGPGDLEGRRRDVQHPRP